MRQVVIIASALVIILGGAYLATSWYLVRVMVTVDRKPDRSTPVELGFPDAEELSFIAPDGVRLIGWFVPSTTDKVIVLVHGIYSNAWDCQAPDIVQAYQDTGLNVFLFDSRGQGRSDGTLGLAWVERLDVRAAVDLMLARGFKAGAIGIHGSSYGAATTILAAATISEIGAILADSSFADVRDVMLGEVARRTILSDGWAQLLSPGLGFMVQRRLRADLDEISPEKAIAEISPRPILLVHGEHDSIIPVRSVHRLGAAAGPNTTVWILPERNHTEGARLVPDCERPSPLRTSFLLRITEFFQQHLKVESNKNSQ
jgi:dipeptidyl aminopeptidase/acylaminoacyl peptidase